MLSLSILSRRLRRLVALSVAALALSGCGRGGTPQGTISGHVTWQGQPLTAGEVNLFQKETGTATTAPLDSSGDFEVDSRMPAGTYNVTFIPPRPKQLPPGTPLDEPLPFPVPWKYQDPTQSDLTAVVKKGSNELEIVIPDS
jgi:hypothetical protein